MANDDFRGTDRFEVLSQLGVGGMGVVYEVFDRDRNTRVALKKLKLTNPEAVVRFKNEFRSLENLQHPNLVMLGELIEDRGQWFFTMELVEGVDFLGYVKARPLRVDTPSSLSADTLHAVPLPQRAGAGAGLAHVPAAGGALAEPMFDEPLLRAALAQLASAVAALHAAGKVHRDIKPSNILVTRAGRLALLDLGLVANIDGDTNPGRGTVAGTASYMAPEQAASGAVGPEADWYAVGVLLYQALTGRLPFDGAPLQVMAAKQESLPPPPSALVRDLPDDLAVLCMDLLHISPDARPPAMEVLRRLRATAEGSHPSSVSTQAPFVGRERELDTIRAAFDRMRAAGGVTVVVEGESGVGKSALVARFTEQLAGAEGDDRPLVLSGRCHEREFVPYRAFDDIVDALARFLGRQPRPWTEALLPRRAALLAQVFPLLRRVEAFAGAQRDPREPAEEQERRAQVFTALRELLTRLAARRPLVLVIDDLQWADADSAALLKDLLRPPDPPPMLLIATVRTGGDAPAAVDLPGDARRIELRPLDDDDARALARQLIAPNMRAGDGVGRGDARAAAADAVARSIAEEARGHPLFITELVRYADTHPGESFARLMLEQALWSRVRRLDASERRLLSVVAVAGAPLRLEVAARAAEARDASELMRWVSKLRTAHLVRTTGVRGSDTVEPYHDRVRAAMLMHLAPEVFAICHRRLAIALEGTPDADHEALAMHWQGAGDAEPAARHALEAARRASEAFAFDRAARLYQLVLELSQPAGEPRAELLALLGDALVNAGRGVDAAAVYLDGAVCAHESVALELRRRAAEQLLRSGHIADGMKVLDQVLSPIGMRLARTSRRALASLLVTRARVRLRGLRFRERPEREVAREQLIRIDTCWAVSIGLALVDTIRASDFQARQLLLALRLGEPFRIARALSAEAGYRSVTGGRDRPDVQAMLARCHEIARRLGDPRAIAMHHLVSGISSYLGGRWLEAQRWCAQAEVIIRDECAGLAWELFNARYYPLLAQFWTGDYAGFLRGIPALCATADERGDLLAGTTLRNGLVAVGALLQDDSARARRESREVVARLPDTFQFQHYWQMVTLTYADLYDGDGAAALDVLRRGWRESERAMLYRIQYIHAEALWLRARANVLAASVTGGAEREQLARLADRHARALERKHMPWIDPLARLVRAGTAAVRGDHDSASALLATAAAELDAVDMAGFAASARHEHGRLLGGDAGAAMTAEAAAWLRARDVVSPERTAAMFVPGFR